MTTAAITCAVLAIDAPETDPVEPLMSRWARAARTSATRGSAKARTARPLKIATTATVAQVELLGSDDTVATPIRATYWAKKITGLAIRELMAQTSATVALVEWDGPAGGGASGIPATSHPWTHNAREAGAGPGVRLDEDVLGAEC